MVDLDSFFTTSFFLLAMTDQATKAPPNFLEKYYLKLGAINGQPRAMLSASSKANRPLQGGDPPELLVGRRFG
ncbi:hypothetical protein C5O19_24450 [Siphonobacter curvatus]|uniref:Uncharacterized protein n=1 Tax=Siphonobacter curvatus TaxID=2094562 RepID=A0A2S7IF16_9BACT|nr:hypothetical protein C5O19_24450 [Siphonobacter curvatus]